MQIVHLNVARCAQESVVGKDALAPLDEDLEDEPVEAQHDGVVVPI